MFNSIRLRLTKKKKKENQDAGLHGTRESVDSNVADTSGRSMSSVSSLSRLSPSATKTRLQVFLSLRFNEAMDAALALKDQIEAQGFSVFLCDVEPGGDIPAQIIDALYYADLAVILGSQTYGQKTASSFSTREELRFIINEKKPFFLVKMCDEFEVPETRFRLSSDISYFEWKPQASKKKERSAATLPEGLIEGIRSKLEALGTSPFSFSSSGLASSSRSSTMSSGAAVRRVPTGLMSELMKMPNFGRQSVSAGDVANTSDSQSTILHRARTDMAAIRALMRGLSSEDAALKLLTIDRQVAKKLQDDDFDAVAALTQQAKDLEAKMGLSEGETILNQQQRALKATTDTICLARECEVEYKQMFAKGAKTRDTTLINEAKELKASATILRELSSIILAKKLIKTSLAIEPLIYETDNPILLLALVLANSHQPADAIETCNELLCTLQDGSFEAGVTLLVKAQALSIQASYHDAQECLIKAASIFDSAAHTAAPRAKATGLNAQGAIANKTGEFQQALEFYGSALSTRKEVLGEDHPDTASTRNDMGTVYDSMGAFDKALEFYNKALETRKTVLGENHLEVAKTLNNIALVLKNKRQADEALDFYNQAITIQQRVIGDDHPDTAKTYSNMGAVFMGQHQYTKAREVFAKSLATRQRFLGPEHPETARSYNSIAVLLKTCGEYTEALDSYTKALKIQQNVLGQGHPDTVSTLHNISVLHEFLGDLEQAERFMQLKLDGICEKYGADHPRAERTRKRIADIAAKRE